MTFIKNIDVGSIKTHIYQPLKLLIKDVRIMINHVVNHNVKEIIIGYNDNFKKEVFDDKYNQWTKRIPLARLRDRIIYLFKK